MNIRAEISIANEDVMDKVGTLQQSTHVVLHEFFSCKVCDNLQTQCTRKHSTHSADSHLSEFCTLQRKNCVILYYCGAYRVVNLTDNWLMWLGRYFTYVNSIVDRLNKLTKMQLKWCSMMVYLLFSQVKIVDMVRHFFQTHDTHSLASHLYGSCVFLLYVQQFANDPFGGIIHFSEDIIACFHITGFPLGINVL